MTKTAEKPREQDHFYKMVTANLGGATALFFAGGFTGNYLLMASAGLQGVANGLFVASKFEKTFGKKRCAEFQKLAFRLFTVNSACVIASGFGIGTVQNPFGIGAMAPDVAALGAFGLVGGIAGTTKGDPTGTPTKLTDIFKTNLLNKAARRQWWDGLNRNKAAAAWYNISSIAPVIGGGIGVTVGLLCGAPAAVVAGAALTMTAGICYLAGNAFLAGSQPKPSPGG